MVPPIQPLRALAVHAARCLLALALLGGASLAAAASAPSVQVSVEDGDWGDARAAEVQAVLASVAGELSSLFGRQVALRVRVSPTRAAPMVLFQRTASGDHQVLLRARGRLWADYVYEFAHELGHIFTNYGRHAREPGLARFQWFEEAVCEMIALHALRRLADAPATGQSLLLSGHRDAMRDFAHQLMHAPHRNALHGADLAAWLRAYEPALRANPYLRNRNEEVATHMLSIFERDPAGFMALGFLNASPSPAPASFADYLADWCEHTPPEAQPVVRKLMMAFGFSPP